MRDGRGHRHDGQGWRMGRGDVKPLLLCVLLEGPAHGYELIRQLEQRSGGAWRPSPGSVYPTLQLLEETELLSGRDDGGKRVYELTDTGRAAAEEVLATSPNLRWGPDVNPESAQVVELRSAIGELRTAVRQVGEVADSPQMDKAVAIIREARQKLYQLLIDA